MLKIGVFGYTKNAMDQNGDTPIPKWIKILIQNNNVIKTII